MELNILKNDNRNIIIIRTISIITILITIFSIVSLTEANELKKPDSKTLSAIINQITGNVKIIQNGKSKDAAIGMSIKKNDTIKVLKNSKVQLKFNNGVIVSYSDEKTIKASEIYTKIQTSKKKSILNLLSGSLKKLKKNDNSNNVTAVAGVRGDDVNQKRTIKDTEVNWEE